MIGFLIGGMIGAALVAIVIRSRDTTNFAVGMIVAYAFALLYGTLAGWQGT
jgi:hypothetical protein